MKISILKYLITTLLVCSLFPTWAQDQTAPVNPPEHADPMSGMDHSQMNHGGATPENPTTDMSRMNHGDRVMNHGAMSMQGGSAPPDERDPHAYSGGYDFSQLPMRHPDHEVKFGFFRADRFESAYDDGDSFFVYDLQTGYGGALDRIMIKAEGDINSGEVEDAKTDLLWYRAITTFWNIQLGLSHNSGEGPDRNELAAGFQGLAPYRFEVDATFYIGEEGRTAINLEVEYDLLFTQKLILQPRIEADFYGKRDAERSLGAGLSDLAIGLRMRYEIRREFAPYMGVEWVNQYGDTANFARDAGADTKETLVVAGVRFWF